MDGFGKRAAAHVRKRTSLTYSTLRDLNGLRPVFLDQFAGSHNVVDGHPCSRRVSFHRSKESRCGIPLRRRGPCDPTGVVHDMYLVEVKKPSESKAPWDYYKVRATIPAAEAFKPLAESNCPLVK